MKALIVSDRKFPHGNAGGVRILNMALSLKEINFDAKVFSIGDEIILDGQVINQFQGVEFYNTPVNSRFKLFSIIKQYFLSGLLLSRALNRELKNVSDNDVVIIYTTNLFFALSCYFGLKRFKTKWWDVVEWFAFERFKFAYVNPKFWLYNLLFNNLYSKGSGVISISSYIRQHFELKNVKTVLYPSVCNFFDNPKMIPLSLNSSRHLELIYSGNPGHKERLDLMLRAVVEANNLNNPRRIRLSFTGVSRKQVLAELCNKLSLKEAEVLLTNVNFYSWLEYDELIEVYRKKHFLFFLRDASHENLCNFPTKLGEMMALGVVPLTNKIGDYGEYLDNSNSVLVDQLDITAIVESLSSLTSFTDDSFRALSQGAIKTAKEELSFSAHSNSLAELIKK
ncbi:glycosyltransferase [Shewanella chilikensis]|uniref:glycosyltransferase n=1 Tax=Shewanella chilikensis TaxID=558541 RepID=UPI0030078BEB